MELPDDSEDASLDSLSLPDSPLPSDTVPVPDSELSDVAPESSSSSSSSSPPDDALKVPDSADDAEGEDDSADDAEASSSSSPLADADSLAELAEAELADSLSESDSLDMDDSVSSSEVSDLQEFLFLVFVAVWGSHRKIVSHGGLGLVCLADSNQVIAVHVRPSLNTTQQGNGGLYSFSIIRVHPPSCPGSFV